jgi:uncharacterized protein YqkB
LKWALGLQLSAVDTVDELIDETRQAVMANIDPEYIPFLLHRHITLYFMAKISLTYKNNFPILLHSERELLSKKCFHKNSKGGIL